MNTTEIKKELYKQKPIAILVFIRKGDALYKTTLENDINIYFNVPVADMGDYDFTSEMDAKLLARWIIENQIED